MDKDSWNYFLQKGKFFSKRIWKFEKMVTYHFQQHRCILLRAVDELGQSHGHEGHHIEHSVTK